MTERKKIFNFPIFRREPEVHANEDMASEKSLGRVSDQADELFRRGYNLAKTILVNHQDYIVGLSNLLLQKPVLSNSEIRKHEAVDENGKIVWRN